MKIPIKIIMDGKRSTAKYPTLFMIDSYRTKIYYSLDENGTAYDMLTNYSKDDMPYWDVMNQWYSGRTYELSK